jgi:putative endopeptidase
VVQQEIICLRHYTMGWIEHGPVNADYHPMLNEIVFPAAILQPPFFTADADDAVNYGRICAVIGHEIGHGFDDQGSQFDGGGALRNWWSEDDRKVFEALTANS